MVLYDTDRQPGSLGTPGGAADPTAIHMPSCSTAIDR